MAQRAKITMSRFASGVVVRVVGAGTIAESPLVYASAEKILRDAEQRVVIDLSACTYVDSTFLGGLVGLFRRHGGSGDRFAIFAPEPLRRPLFGVSRLDTILPFAEEEPVTFDEGIPVDMQLPTSPEELARHVADCHRRLSEVGGPEAKEFARVADAITAEAERKLGTE
jgi:anti-sigma B factor antagonist